MKCEYKVSILGKREVIAQTEEELDNIIKEARLKGKFNGLLNNNNHIDFIFDEEETDEQKQQNTRIKLREIEKELNSYEKKQSNRKVKQFNRGIWNPEIQDYEIKLDSEGGLLYGRKGVYPISKAPERIGNRKNPSNPAVTKKDDVEYKAIRVGQLYSKYIKEGKSIVEAKQLAELDFDAEQIDAQNSAKAGEDYHALLQRIAENKQLEAQGKPIQSLNVVQNEVLTKKDIENARPTCENIINDIWDRYNFSKDAEVFTEYEIVSKRVGKFALMGLNSDSSAKEEIKALGGRIDLMVVDKGKVYLFDFKTSRKEVGSWLETSNEVCSKNNWWPTTKKLNSLSQLAFYASVMEQYGCVVGGMEIIPMVAIPKKNIQTYTQDDQIIAMSKDINGNDIENIETFYWDRNANFEKGGNKKINRQTPKLRQLLRRAEGTLGIIPPPNTEKFENANNFLSAAFGKAFTVAEQTRITKATIDIFKGNNKRTGKPYIQELLPSDYMYTRFDPQTKSPYRYYLYKATSVRNSGNNLKKNSGYEDGDKIYFTEEEYINRNSENAKIDIKLNKYLEQLKESQESIYGDFMENGLLEALSGNITKRETLEEGLLSHFGKNHILFVEHLFKKYYEQGWNLVQEPDLIRNGYFIFYSGGQIEIVCLSNLNLAWEYQFGTNRNKRNTILGEQDVDKNHDDSIVLSSSFGNMKLMEIMAVLNSNPDLFVPTEDGTIYKINSIMVANPVLEQTTTTDNDFLLSNWSMLCAKMTGVSYNIGNEKVYTFNGKNNLSNTNAFYTSLESAFNKARSSLLNVSYNRYYDVMGIDDRDFEVAEEDLRNVLRLIRLHRRGFKKDTGEIDLTTEEGFAYMQLSKGLLAAQNLRYIQEKDHGKYLEGGIMPTGTFITNPPLSASANMRVLSILNDKFRARYTLEYEKKSREISKKIARIYQLFGFNPNTNNHRKFWEQFFKHEGDRVSPEMEIRHFEDTWWDQDSAHKEAKNLFEDILEYWGENRINPKWDQDGNLIKGDNYYQVPLMTTGLGDYIRKFTAEMGFKGLPLAIFEKCKEMGQDIKDLYFNLGKDVNKDWMSYASDINGNIVYNRYLQLGEERRREILNSAQTTPEHNAKIAFETDIQAIFNGTCVATEVNKASEDFGILFSGIKSAIAYDNIWGGMKTPELADAVDKYITHTVYRQAIQDASLAGANRLKTYAQRVSSIITLGLNVRAFTREMLVSLYNSYLASKTDYLGNITSKDFADAMLFVYKHAPANLNQQGFVGQMNAKFALTDMSREEMEEYNYISRFALGTVDASKIAYLGTTIPDNYYRVAILLARMSADHCRNSYIQIGDEWVYDAGSDDRYKKYLSKDNNGHYIFQEYNSSLGDWDTYINAKMQWNDSVNAWKQIYPDREIFEPLEAYTPEQMGEIRVQGAKLFGFFDNDTKSMLCFQFIGSALMQYKTWLSAKINRWFKAPGATTIKERIHVTNKDGKKIYLLASTSEEIKNGEYIMRFVTEDEVNEHPEWKLENRLAPYIVEEGQQSEGMFITTERFISSILGIGDENEYRKIWEDPVRRGNLIAGFIDMWGMMLLAAIINLLYGEDVVNNRASQNWVTQWSYGALMGFAQDGPVHQVLGSMITDWNPPALSSLQQLAQTAQSVLHGNKSVPQGLIESFGATREFRGYFGQR